MTHPSIVLLGNSGVGKSASGNTILGRTAFESRRAFKSVTTNIQEETEQVFGRNISVIDTPGILRKGSEMEIQTFCQENLDSSSCLFLVVVKIDRFTEEQLKAVEAAIRVIEPYGLQRAYLLFAGADHLDGTLEEFINQEEEFPLQRIIETFEERFFSFNNKNGGPDQVKELLQKTGILSPSEKPPAEKRKIVLYGLSGAGKSSSGNTILGSKKFKSGCGFVSGTKTCVSMSVIVGNQEITVIDTPGVDDSSRSPEEVAEDILEALHGEHIHALVIVVKIDRISKADCMFLKYFPYMFGPKASGSTMVLFTHGDDLSGEHFEEKIKASKEVSEMIRMCKGRYCVFDNTQSRNREQVRCFLQIVDEMVQRNGEQRCDKSNHMPFPEQRCDKSNHMPFPEQDDTSPRHSHRRPKGKSVMAFFTSLIQCIRCFTCCGSRKTDSDEEGQLLYKMGN